MNEFSYGPLDQRIGELERLLSTPPIFRSVPTGRPVVYGYIRSSHRRARYVRACRRVLERFCWQERLRLCGVFVDYGIAGDVVIRPGLSGLCDVLRLPDSFAAVTISAAHLASDATIADALTHRLRATGARLLVVHPKPPPECDASAESSGGSDTGQRAESNRVRDI
ncbi:hypothetical protein [Haloechinothrix salitolerans]|uniref:Resolvase/invertase-type recombinase catalytic domain-containing protein n=1 Tax=Haloechinothrix salitolerans TaxID=926830 RepID=A0ABW2C0C4_9PSEU